MKKSTLFKSFLFVVVFACALLYGASVSACILGIDCASGSWNTSGGAYGPGNYPPTDSTITMPCNGTVVAMFIGENSSLSNSFGISSPVNRALGTSATAPHTNYDIGQVSQGTELIFYIKTPVTTFYSNGSHGKITKIANNQYRIGFEDKSAVADWDYNDITLLVTITCPAPQPIVCSTNSQCGTDGFIGSATCNSNGDVARDYKIWTCNNPGTANSSCSNAIESRVVTDCTANQICQNATCVDQHITCSTNSQCGTDGFIGSATCNSNGDVVKDYKIWTCNNPGTPASSCSNTIESRVITDCTANQTCSGGSCVDQHITCTTNSQCGTNGFIGSPFCANGDVYKTYRTYTCVNPGTSSSRCTNDDDDQKVSDCTANQTCSGGACHDGQIACTTNSQCGTDGYVGSPFCQNGDVYKTYRTYTCQDAGTSNSRCTQANDDRVVTDCTANQTCSSGSCSNINNCTNHSYQQCSGNYLYWYDSCGNRQDSQYCANGCNSNSCGNQNCTYHSYQRCSGNYLYWYDSCGVQQDAQFCPNGCNNNSCQYYQPPQQGYLTVSKTVRNLTTSTYNNFSSSVYAQPGDTVMFMITLQATGNQTINNVYVRDAFPANLFYRNQMTMAGTNSYSGDVLSGINIPYIYAGQTVTITYQAQVAPASSFSFGTTSINNSVSVTSSSSSYTPVSNATVYVTRTAVYGASSISTGLTNNIWADSFIIPLLIALFGIWMWKAGLLMWVEKWLDARKKSSQAYSSQKELLARISAIKKAQTN